jgi:hypothetical protein
MNEYGREIGRTFNNGKKVGYTEGVAIQKAIFNNKIDNKIADIKQLKEEFKLYRMNAENKQEKEYWTSELASLIKQQRLLKELKEE